LRAVVLAGGYAKRMWPITHDFPKPLLPISGRPAIDYIIDKLLEIDIDRIFVFLFSPSEDDPGFSAALSPR